MSPSPPVKPASSGMLKALLLLLVVFVFFLVTSPVVSLFLLRALAPVTEVSPSFVGTAVLAAGGERESEAARRLHPASVLHRFHDWRVAEHWGYPFTDHFAAKLG